NRLDGVRLLEHRIGPCARVQRASPLARNVGMAALAGGVGAFGIVVAPCAGARRTGQLLGALARGAEGAKGACAHGGEGRREKSRAVSRFPEHRGREPTLALWNAMTREVLPP